MGLSYDEFIDNDLVADAVILGIGFDSHAAPPSLIKDLSTIWLMINKIQLVYLLLIEIILEKVKMLICLNSISFMLGWLIGLVVEGCLLIPSFLV